MRAMENMSAAVLSQTSCSSLISYQVLSVLVVTAGICLPWISFSTVQPTQQYKIQASVRITQMEPSRLVPYIFLLIANEP